MREEKEIVKKIDVIQQDLIDDTGHSMVDKIDVLQKLHSSMKQFDSSDIFLNHEHYSEKERERLSETLFIGRSLA